MKTFLYKVSANIVGWLGAGAIMVGLFPDLTTQLITLVIQWMKTTLL